MARRLVSSSFLFLLIALFLAAVFGLSGCGGGSPATVTIVKPSSTNVDPGQSVTLTANVTNDSKGVTWSMTGTGCTGSGCGTLTDPADTATYTAPSTVATAFTVTITATAVGQTTKTSSITLSIPANPAITTPGGALTAGQVGSTYTVTLAISGGISPYTWSVTQGNLPTGLTLGASTGIISGTPTASGSYTFTLKVADSGSPALTASAQFSIAISAAPPIVFSTTSLSSATYNVAYTATVAATGGAGALTYAVTTGSLPHGLTMSSAGAITGTPTAAGTVPFTVTASDAYGDSAQQALSITVNYPAIVISPAAGALPGGQYKVAYSQTLTATGGSGSGYTWSVTSGAASLTAVNLSVSSSGAITGTPQATGNASFTVQVTDSYGDTQTASYTIAVTYPALSVTTAALPGGMVGLAYSPVTLAATGGSGAGYSWSVTSGTALSATGLALSSGGVITGTPTTAESAASVTVQVQDSANNKATATLTLTIYSALTITSTTLPNGTYGAAYSTNLAATGGDGSSLTWSTTSGAALTSVGLTLSSAGVLSGTLPAPQNAPLPNCQSGKAYCLSISVSVVNSDNAAFTTSASAALTIVYPALAVSTSTLPSAVDGTLYSQQLAATGGSGTGYSWSTSGTNNLSTFNLALSTAGLLSGTPPANTTGTATFTAKVTDSFGNTATANLSVTVNGSLTITTATLPYATTGTLYSQTLAATGGSGGYTWSTTGASNLATFNLTLSSAGVLSGTPTSTGTASFTAQVKDSSNATATAPFSFAVYNPLSQNATNLALTGTTGVAYSGTVTAVGGSGNYSWTVTGLSDNLTQSASGGTLTISGTPGSAATVAITVKLTDTTTTAFVSSNYSIVISNPAPLTLPSPNPTSLGSATVNQSYSGAINATGGVSPFTWKINGTTVTSGNLSVGNGLNATNNGGNTLSISGTASCSSPPCTVTLSNVTVTDSESTPVTAGPDTYSIQVNPAGSSVSGQLFLQNYCYNGNSNLPVTFTVTLTNSSTNQVQATTTTDTNGDYSFTAIPDGTYTITPSIAGAASLFYPTSISTGALSASGTNNLQGQNFNAEVGFTVSGTVSYSGSQTGQTYVEVNNNSCGSSTGTGIATLTSGGAFTVRGVSPGSNTVVAWMDPLGQGSQNAIDPTGSASITVDANVSNADITIADPTFTTPTSNPTIQVIVPTPQGVLIEFNPSQNSNGEEDANQYTVQWSTSPTLGGGTGGGQFLNIAGSHTFKAGGGHGTWLLTNALLGAGTFASGQTYYFQARSFNTLDTANPHPSGWCNYTSTGCSGITGFTGVTIGAVPCTGSCTSVSSSVTIPNSITINSGAPLYLGLVQITGGGNPTGIYVTEIASPVNGANDFTVTVPSGSNYAVVGVLDQNNSGDFGVGTISNTNDLNQGTLTISGSTQTVAGITLPTANSVATVSTLFSSSSCQGCGSPSTNYQLHFNVEEADKLPVAVTITSGPNLINTSGTVAIDMASNCQDCGTPQSQYYTTLPGGTPHVGDTYDFTVTYSDGSKDTGTAVTGAVTGWNGGSTVVGASDAPSNLSPSGTNSASTTPTFTWTDPASSQGSNFYYSFNLESSVASNCNGNTYTIWQIPGQNSNSNGFSSSITSITWGTDPTGGGSTPCVSSLTTGDAYYWTIQVQDQNGNEAWTSVWYEP